MKTDSIWKWQAFLDGELPAPEHAECQRILEQDPEAQAVVGELRHIRQALRGNEPRQSLPVHGDFYWSQIQARLAPAAQEASPPRSHRGLSPAFWRWFAPLGATAALAMLLIYGSPRQPAAEFVAEEIDTPLPDANFFTFRSLSDGISVVWVDTQAGYTRMAYPDDSDYLMQ